MTARAVEDRTDLVCTEGCGFPGTPEPCGGCCCCTNLCAPVPPPRPARRIATRLLAATVFHREAKAERDAAYDEARSSGLFDTVGVREIGLVGDEQIGHVRVQPPEWEAVLADEAAFVAWADSNHPGWVESGTVLCPGTGVFPVPFRRVHRIYVDQVLNSVRLTGKWVDETTGVVYDPPPGFVRKPGRHVVLDVVPSRDAAATLRGSVVTVPASLLAHLRAAREEFEVASDSHRGECRDEIVAVAFALLDEIPGEVR